MDQQEAVRTERRGGILSRLPFRPSERQPSESLDTLLRTVKAHSPKVDLKDIQAAYAFAEASHEGQKRLSGEDFIEHPVAVATIVADLGMDTVTLQAALLHDMVEDTVLTLDDVRREFGDQVADHRRRPDQAGPDQVPLARAGAGRERAQDDHGDGAATFASLLIKLADRLHNMRTLDVFSRQKQQEKASETLEIYAPLAHRLGVDSIKWELEDLSFKALHPRRYEEIAQPRGEAGRRASGVRRPGERAGRRRRSAR